MVTLKNSFIFQSIQYTVWMYSKWLWGEMMKDFHMESVQLQRIDLITRTLVNDLYSEEDKDVAVVWLAEIVTGLIADMHEQGVNAKSPQ